MIQDNKTEACSKKRYEVTSQDLPLSCPLPTMRLWNAHPCVFLPIEKTGEATCPYCSAQFILTDSKSL